ncbi:DUF2865 domain-containing protein [Methylobacterium nigriterrae]|uniref:DUF2865 domain-containing protein n=1 Tax=Methylobacterium nigriterrae TaxID=3127512 RepID=UPI003013A2E6
MAFSAHWRRLVALGGTRRQMIGTALAGLILGMGSVTIGTSLVHASERNGLFGFLEDLFRPPPPPATVPPPRRPAHYANLPDARRAGLPRAIPHTPRRLVDLAAPSPLRRRVARRRAPAATVASLGPRTVCVRSCDGYLFPLGTLGARADIPVHRAACAAACPGAATSLYSLPAGETELERAVSLEGHPYRAAAFANVYRQRRVADCSCQPPGGAPPLPIVQDLTLRRGDVVATQDSAEVVTRIRPGSVALTDYRAVGALPRARSGAIEERVGALRREAEVRAFRRAMRAADRGGIVRVAAAGPGFAGLGRTGTAGFAPVRIVAPSPYLR